MHLIVGLVRRVAGGSTALRRLLHDRISPRD